MQATHTHVLKIRPVVQISGTVRYYFGPSEMTYLTTFLGHVGPIPDPKYVTIPIQRVVEVAPESVQKGVSIAWIWGFLTPFLGHFGPHPRPQIRGYPHSSGGESGVKMTPEAVQKGGLWGSFLDPCFGPTSWLAPLKVAGMPLILTPLLGPSS